MVECCQILEAKKIPSDARVTALVFGRHRRPISCPAHIIKEYCYCVSTFHNSKFQLVMRSGRFANWLSYSPTRIRRPLKCCEGIYVEASDGISTIALRLRLLDEAFGVLEECYLEYESAGDAFSQELQVEYFHKLSEDRARRLRPVNIVFGKNKFPVKCWPDCLSVFRTIVRTELPFGETLVPALPSGYATYSIGKVLVAMVDLIKTSSVDRYSVSVECAVALESVLVERKFETDTSVTGEKTVIDVKNSEIVQEVGCERDERTKDNRHFAPRFEVSA